MNRPRVRARMGVALLALAWALNAFAAEPPTLETVMQELRAIREKQDEMELRLIEIQKQSKSSGVPIMENHRRGADEVALAAIVLPENATKEQLHDYVKQVIAATKGQNTFSSEDPQVAMLAKVGPRNVDVLLSVLGMRRTNMEYYILPAIGQIADNENKALILQALAVHHDLASVINEKEWAKDAKDTLIQGLRDHNGRLPTEWIEAVASLADPATYDLLTAYLVAGDNPSGTYTAIKSLPGIDLDEAVAKVWAVHKDSGDGLDWWRQSGIAAMAAEHGHVDALGQLIALQQDEKNQYWAREMRRTVFRLSGTAGTDAEMLQWFVKNKDKLVFDSKAGKYMVKPEAEGGVK